MAGGLLPEDSISTNDAFSCGNKKIQVKVLSLAVAPKAGKAQENRRFAIDACLVRIMKSRKTLSIQALVDEAAK